MKDVNFYDKESGTYSDKRYPKIVSSYNQFFFTERLRIVLKMLDKNISEKKNLSLLEIGCADGIVIENGEVKNVAGIRVEAIASYDLIPGTPFHPKGRGNGYVITLGDKRIYFSGVTECVPEVQALRNIDVAFVVMNSPNGRMTPAAAAGCVATFKPKVVYPYHYRTGNVAEFKTALEGKPVDVRLGDWYPVAAK